MTTIIRTINKGLPRVSMARIPVVAFANTTHPSAYSSSSWAESAKNAADKLENSAKNLAHEVNNRKKGDEEGTVLQSKKNVQLGWKGVRTTLVAIVNAYFVFSAMITHHHHWIML
jgi:hypothetical protein